MSRILVAYSAEPNFPATDQQPAAQRYRVGPYWVDAVGGEPTPAEVKAALHPILPPSRDESLRQPMLTARQAITQAKTDLAAATTVAQVKAAMQAVISSHESLLDVLSG
jgi:hypothetical protein